MHKEIELKYCPVDKDETRQKLQAAGFTLKQPEFRMRRVLMHNTQLPDRWARVRQEANKITTAIKRVIDKDAIDGTEEIEMTVASIETAVKYLEACGFTHTSFHENDRELWVRGDLEATIDTWPGLPPLMEIEGPEEDAVYGAAVDMGFDRDKALFGSIDFVYEAIVGIPQRYICENDMLFDDPPNAALILKQAG